MAFLLGSGQVFLEEVLEFSPGEHGIDDSVHGKFVLFFQLCDQLHFFVDRFVLDPDLLW